MCAHWLLTAPEETVCPDVVFSHTGAEVTAFIPLKGHKRKVNACAYNGNGSLIATVGNDKTIRIWSLQKALHPPEDEVVKRGVEGMTHSKDKRMPESTSR